MRRLTSRLIQAAVVLSLGFITDPISARLQEGPTEQGYAALQANEIAKAIELFQSAVKANAKDIAAYVGLGRAYQASRKPAEAVQAFQSAVDLNPNQADLRLQFAGALLQANRGDDAFRQFQRAADLAPRRAQPLVGMSEILVGKQEISQAVDLLLKARGYEPDNPLIHFALGRAYASKEDWAPGVASLEAALRLQPQLLMARMMLVTGLNSLQRFEETRNQCRLILSSSAARDPNVEMQTRAALAIAQDGLGAFGEAIKEYLRCLELNPQAAVLWGNLGWAQYGAKQYDAAIKSSRKALELDPGLGYVRYNLGLIFACKGERAEAEKEYLEALKAGSRRDYDAGLKDLREAALVKEASPVIGEMIAWLMAREKEVKRT